MGQPGRRQTSYHHLCVYALYKVIYDRKDLFDDRLRFITIITYILCLLPGLANSYQN